MKNLLTFDCYGTLIDTSPFMKEIARIGEEHHMNGDQVSSIYLLNEARIMYAEPYLPLDSQIAAILTRCDAMMKTSFMENEYERMLEVQKSLQAFPEVIPTLKELKTRGYQLVIMSNSCRSIMNHNLNALDHQIDDFILAEDVHAYKPQLSFFEKSENILDIKNQNHYHIAQGYFEDIIPGARMKWNTVWVNRNRETAVKEYQPCREVTTLDQILPFFDDKKNASLK